MDCITWAQIIQIRNEQVHNLLVRQVPGVVPARKMVQEVCIVVCFRQRFHVSILKLIKICLWQQIFHKLRYFAIDIKVSKIFNPCWLEIFVAGWLFICDWFIRNNVNLIFYRWARNVGLCLIYEIINLFEGWLDL